MQITERLEAAEHSAAFAVSDLQEALKGANAVEALAILPLIGAAADLQQRIVALRDAAAEVSTSKKPKSPNQTLG